MASLYRVTTLATGSLAMPTCRLSSRRVILIPPSSLGIVVALCQFYQCPPSTTVILVLGTCLWLRLWSSRLEE
ncbi:hypothetical protein F4677DRAFT_414179 [Hypoxylon crocopeplum]|nr:hypothetical protein F4677DRAFT_414179 [Hypoxylon crocopeplum]